MMDRSRQGGQSFSFTGRPTRLCSVKWARFFGRSGGDPSHLNKLHSGDVFALEYPLEVLRDDERNTPAPCPEDMGVLYLGWVHSKRSRSGTVARASDSFTSGPVTQRGGTRPPISGKRS
jgi:hypothetical protein